MRGTILAIGVYAALAPLKMSEATAGDWTVPAVEAVAPADLTPRLEVDVTAAVDLRKAVFAAAERFDRVTRSQPDLERLVLDLALDPRAAFEFVRDEVASVPYAGRLRSPQAVLVAGAGNAHDKAVTLAEILRRMGYDTRLIGVDVAQPVPVEETCRPPAPGDGDVFLLSNLGPEMLTRVSERARNSYAVLRPHIAPAQSGAAGGGGHVWLQVRDGADWVDLDPWRAGTSWGEHPAGEGVPLDVAPEPQTVEIKVITETLKAGKLREAEVLSAKFDVPEAAEDWISLSFGPEVEGVGGILSEALGGIQGISAPMKAVLTVNSQPRYSRVFAAPGVPTDNGVLGSGDTPDITTAIHLEIRTIGPGLPDEIERRTVVDLVPADIRGAHREGSDVDPAALLPVTPGERFPAELESLRHIVISNGGMSRRLEAARTVRDLLALPATAASAQSGQPDLDAMLWSTWLQARRFALASEELVRVRPGHQGGCTHITRPRVTTWGLANGGGDHRVQWIDWTLDAIGVVGGSPDAQAEMRLWHGALQSALETELLMWLTQAPADHFPLDTAALAPLVADARAAAGVEVDGDEAKGYTTLASADSGDGHWWRVDPATGRADARARSFGNSRYYNPWSNYVNASRGGIVTISEQELALLERDLARLGPQGFADKMGELEDIRQAEAAKKKKGGGTEYTIILFNVSIPISVAAGTTVGVIVIGGLLVALYG